MEVNARARPSEYDRAVARWGEPVGIERARGRWAELVAEAEAGSITLIARDDDDRIRWAALVPIRELTVPLDGLPMWSMRAARPKLGELVDAASAWPGRPVAQVLTRHRRPVAALVSALDVSYRKDFGERLDLDAVLQDGVAARVWVQYDPGTSGHVYEDGAVDPPEPGGFMALAEDFDGVQVGCGFGGTALEALLSLYRPRQTGDLPAEFYDTEPPF